MRPSSRRGSLSRSLFWTGCLLVVASGACAWVLSDISPVASRPPRASVWGDGLATSGPRPPSTASAGGEVGLASVSSDHGMISEEIVRRTPAKRRGEPSFQVALRQWLEVAPGEALAWLGALDDAAGFADVVDAAVIEWSNDDPVDALAWVLDQAEGARRDRWLAGVVQSLADYDPRLAGDYARELLPAGEARRRALEGVAVSWARHDPGAAAKWAFGVEQTGEPEVAGLVLYPWYSEAQADVVTWIDGLPASPARDRLLARLIGWQLEKDSGEAAALIGKISDPELRASMTTAWVRHWADEDFFRAAAWVRSVPGSALRERLVAVLDASSREASGFRR